MSFSLAVKCSHQQLVAYFVCCLNRVNRVQWLFRVLYLEKNCLLQHHQSQVFLTVVVVDVVIWPGGVGGAMSLPAYSHVNVFRTAILENVWNLWQSFVQWIFSNLFYHGKALLICHTLGEKLKHSKTFHSEAVWILNVIMINLLELKHNECKWPK